MNEENRLLYLDLISSKIQQLNQSDLLKLYPFLLALLSFNELRQHAAVQSENSYPAYLKVIK